MDLRDAVGEYAGSEYFAMLPGVLKDHAEVLLLDLIAGAVRARPEFPDDADAQLLVAVLAECVPRLGLPSEVRQGAATVLAGFCEYLAETGRCPAVREWLAWLPEVEAAFAARLRDDGTVRGTTLRRGLPAVGRNAPCPCGSGRKFKHCCIGLLS